MNELAVDTKDIDREGLARITEAKELVVTSNEEFQAASVFLKGLKALEKQINETFDPSIRRAKDLHSGLLAEKKKHSEPLLQAEIVVKQKMLTYSQQVERRRQEEIRQAQAAARKKAEEEALRKAEEAEKNGHHEKAERILEAPLKVAPVVIKTEAPKVSGISVRTTYSAEVVDFMALVKAVAAGTVPPTALQANTVFLNSQARALKDELRYPGVQVIEKRGMSAGV